MRVYSFYQTVEARDAVIGVVQLVPDLALLAVVAGVVGVLYKRQLVVGIDQLVHGGASLVPYTHLVIGT